VEHGEEDEQRVIEAFSDGEPNRTVPGHFVRRLHLWLSRRSKTKTIEKGLHRAIDGIANAWVFLGGIERLADRAAVCILLARAMQLNGREEVAEKLREEANELKKEIPDKSVRSLVTSAQQQLTQSDMHSHHTFEIDDEDGRIARLLMLGQASEAVDVGRKLQSQESPDSISPDARLARLVLLAEAARRAECSSRSLEILDTASERLRREAKPSTVWAYQYLRAGVHWTRYEYAAAFIEIEQACKSVGCFVSVKKLWHTHLLRKKIAKDLKISEMVEESERVVQLLEMLLATPKLDTISIQDALGLGVAGYTKALERVRRFHQDWNAKTQPRQLVGRMTGAKLGGFGRQLKKMRDECADVAPKKNEEPLLYAQMRADQVSAALVARYEWIGNSSLFQATVQPWLISAETLADRVEALRLHGYICKAIIVRYSTALPYHTRIPSPSQDDSVTKGDLMRVYEQLKKTKKISERRYLQKFARRVFEKYLDSNIVMLFTSEELAEIVKLLQQLKDTEFDRRLIARRYTDKSEILLEEDTHLENSAMEPPKEWLEHLQARLEREDAICVEYVVATRKIYGVIYQVLSGRLSIKMVDVAEFRNRNGEHKDAKHTINQYRAWLRQGAQKKATRNNAGDIVDQQRNKLKKIGGELTATINKAIGDGKTIYIAPSLGLHGIPLHEIWKKKAVLQVLKAKQLAMENVYKDGPVVVIAGPEEPFKDATEWISVEVGAQAIVPNTYKELRNNLAESKIAVLVAHGWFDHERPERTRISLDKGLRLTIRDIQEMKLKGTEIILLSCWAGWSIRGNLPPGERHGGPNPWFIGGTGAVLAPLWPIPIQAGSEFIVEYITKRMNGRTRIEAIHHARGQYKSFEYELCKMAFVLWGVDSA